MRSIIEAARSERGSTRLVIAGFLATAMLAVGAIAALAAESTPPSPRPSPPRPPAGGPPNPGTPGLDADGVITQVSGSGISIRNLFGKVLSYTISSSTKVHQGPATAVAAGSMTAGERAHVRGQQSSGTGLIAIEIDLQLAHIDGVVTSVSGTTLTVMDRDGFSRKVVTSASTIYRKKEAQVAVSAVTAGSVIHAEGRVDRDSTSLDAVRINIELPPGS